MFDILKDIDDGLFWVYYSGTLLDTFDSREDAENYVNTIKMEIEVYYGVC
jgi:beta-xylosidase